MRKGADQFDEYTTGVTLSQVSRTDPQSPYDVDLSGRQEATDSKNR